jgi:epoxyqueuosine reductase
MEKPRRRAGRSSAGRASTPIWCRASSARGCSSARSSPRSTCRPDAREDDHCGKLPCLPRRLPDGGVPRSPTARCRRCISYLTIEHKGRSRANCAAAWANRIYGCDDCLAVCPWNKFAQPAARRSSRRARRCSARAGELARLDDRGVPQAVFEIAGQAHRRDRFVRNVLIAIGNSGDTTLAAEAERIVGDASPLVRGAAVWALSRLLPPERLAALAATRQPQESEPLVADEWTAALGAAAA